MTTDAIITVHMDVVCSRCRSKGATDNGLCMACIGKGISAGAYDHILKKGDAMKQEKLIKPTLAEINEMKIKLANVTIQYLKLEAEKKTADDDYSGRLKELWAEIESIEKQING